MRSLSFCCGLLVTLVGCQTFSDVSEIEPGAAGGGAGGMSGSSPAAGQGGQPAAAGAGQGGAAGKVGGGAGAAQAGASPAGNAGTSGTGGAGGNAAGAPAGGQAGQGGSGGDGGGSSGAGTSGASSGGQAGAGGTGGASGQGGAGAGMGGAGPGGGTTFYVDSTNGDDSGDGTSPASAFKTIQRGVQAAKPGDQVLVCVGSYSLATTLELTNGIAVRGGYSCGTFAFPPPLPKASACETTPGTIVSGSASPLLRSKDVQVTLSDLHLRGSGAVVLEVSGEGLTLQNSRLVTSGYLGLEPSVTLRLRGPGTPLIEQNCILAWDQSSPAGISTSMGVEIVEGSSANLVGNYIHGGKGKGKVDLPGDGSVGVRIAGSSPNIHENVIMGGEGSSQTTSRAGSVGIRIDAEGTMSQVMSPRIHDNTEINGGSGTGQVQALGSVGVLIFCPGVCPLNMTQNSALRDNLNISGGTGSSTNEMLPTAGLVVIGGAQSEVFSLDIVRNRIRASDATKPSSSGLGPRAVVLFRTSANLYRNLVLGAPLGAFQDTVAIQGTELTNSALVNNVIHGGTSTGMHYGVILNGGADVRLLHNTIIAAQKNSAGVGILARSLAPALITNLTLQNNLLLGSSGLNAQDTLQSVGLSIYTDGCIDQFPLKYAGNGFANYLGHGKASAAFVYNQPKCAEGAVVAFETVKQFAAHFTAPDNVENIDISGSCPDGDPYCRSLDGCSGQSTCSQAMFSPWTDDGNYGVARDENMGWRLRSDLRCDLHRVSKLPNVQQDLKEKARIGDTASRGSDEQPDCLP